MARPAGDGRLEDHFKCVCGRVWEVVPAPRDDWRQWSEYKRKNPVPAMYTKIVEQRYYGMRVSLYSRKEP